MLQNLPGLFDRGVLSGNEPDRNAVFTQVTAINIHLANRFPVDSDFGKNTIMGVGEKGIRGSGSGMDGHVKDQVKPGDIAEQRRLDIMAAAVIRPGVQPVHQAVETDFMGILNRNLIGTAIKRPLNHMVDVRC